MDAAFMGAIGVIEEKTLQVLKLVPDSLAAAATELVLRAQAPLYLVTAGGVVFIRKDGSGTAIAPEQAYRVSRTAVAETLMRACGFAVYAHRRELQQGFITYGNGYRMTVTGKNAALVPDGTTVEELRIRIAREKKCNTDYLFQDGKLCSVLIGGSPGAGKTTHLRSAAYALASGEYGRFYRVAIVDERGELAADGFASGATASILRGVSKVAGIARAVRLFSPEVILCDEISGEEISSITQALNSGVAFVASMHCGSQEELWRKPGFQAMLHACVFQRVVLLQGSDAPGKIKTISETEGLCNENMVAAACMPSSGNTRHSGACASAASGAIAAGACGDVFNDAVSASVTFAGGVAAI